MEAAGGIQGSSGQHRAVGAALSGEAMGRLAGGVAHDLNNTLTLIFGAVDLGRRAMQDPEKVRQAFDHILLAAERSARLSRQLVAFSSVHECEPRVVDPNRVIRDFEKQLRRLLGPDIEVAIQGGAGVKAVRADPGQIEQVVLNLALNAQDAMPHGGILLVSTANVPAGAPELVEAGCAPDEEHVRIRVADTGFGMTPDVKARLFEPFFTTKATGRGAGLGLATCLALVSQNGGRIGVDTTPGKGTAFRIYFRAVEGGREPLLRLVTDDPPRGSETVLVVDDEALVRRVAAEGLRGLGYQVFEAADGDEAIRRARSGGRIHLLITDVMLPKMSGREVAEQVKFRQAGIKTLFTSGYAVAGPGHEVVVERETFLAKPFTPRELGVKVRQILQS